MNWMQQTKSWKTTNLQASTTSLLNRLRIWAQFPSQGSLRCLMNVWALTRSQRYLLKPGKDPASLKSYNQIFLLFYTYKVLERLILNHLAPFIDTKLIPEQAGFRSGKYCASQLLNFTQFFEDVFEKVEITGTAFIDLSTEYDPVSLGMIGDLKFTLLVRKLLLNRRFFAGNATDGGHRRMVFPRKRACFLSQ